MWLNIYKLLVKLPLNYGYTEATNLPTLSHPDKATFFGDGLFNLFVRSSMAERDVEAMTFFVAVAGGIILLPFRGFRARSVAFATMLALPVVGCGTSSDVDELPRGMCIIDLDNDDPCKYN